MDLGKINLRELDINESQQDGRGVHYTLTQELKEKFTVHPNLMPTTTKKSLLMGSRCTISSQSLGRHAQILHCAKRMVDLVFL